jgi:hypothetical protein
MYKTYNPDARNMILFFLDKYFKDKENLVTPIHSLVTNMDTNYLGNFFNRNIYVEDYKILNQEVRKLGINIPPLISAYMNLSPSMRVFGTAVNEDFGEVEETGILIDFEDIFEDKKKRHVESFLRERPTRKWIAQIQEMIGKARIRQRSQREN